jgi:hypothetical protein
MEPYLKDGTGIADLEDNTNVLVVRARVGGNSVGRFMFQSDGTAYAEEAWTTFSDNRLKFNQEIIPYGLAEVLRLQPKKYNKDSGSLENGTPVLMHTDNPENRRASIGFIAQEVKAIIPELVKDIDENTSWYSLEDGKLMAVVVRAIQELSAKVTTLEAA